MAISRIKDPLTGNAYSRDESVAGSTYAPDVMDTTNLAPDNALAPAAPTVADAYKGLQISPYQGGAYDSALSNFGADSLRALNTPLDEESEFRKSMRGYQTEVDAANRLFATQLAELNQDKYAAVGRARAMEAAGLGSYSGVQSATRQANRPIDAATAQQEARIAAISNAARTAAQQEIQTKRAARQSGYQNYLSFLRESDTRRQTNAESLADTIIAQGLALEDIDPTVLASAAKDYGVSENAVRNAFYMKQQEAEAAAQARADKLAGQNLIFNPETQQYEELIPTYETLSEGQALIDPRTGRVIASRAKTYAPKSGGLSDTDTNNAAIADTSNIISTVDEALSEVGTFSAGFIGGRTDNIPGTPAYNLQKTIDTLKANLSFDELAKMRAASKTGGALGSITERELQLLGSTVASLDIGQSPEKLRSNLETIKKRYENVQAGLMGIELTD